MPIRYIIDIEHMKNGQTSMGMRHEESGKVSPHEMASAVIITAAVKQGMEAIRALSHSSQYAEGHSAEVLKKIIERERKDINRLPEM